MVCASIDPIPATNLLLMALPLLAVISLLWRWSAGWKEVAYGLARMVGQLVLIGYVLVFLFAAETPWIVLGVLVIMIFSAAWIALRTDKENRPRLYFRGLLSILTGGGVTLVLVTQGVLKLEPWYAPDKTIPLAGMIFSGAMNCVSLCLDRVKAELGRGLSWEESRCIAFRASLIPITNSLFAVGLVSLPGMMTGQILSGTEPLIAARYQILVMAMMLSSAGLASAIFLVTARPLLQAGGKDRNAGLSTAESG